MHQADLGTPLISPLDQENQAPEFWTWGRRTAVATAAAAGWGMPMAVQHWGTDRVFNSLASLLIDAGGAVGASALTLAALYFMHNRQQAQAQQVVAPIEVVVENPVLAQPARKSTGSFYSHHSGEIVGQNPAPSRAPSPADSK